MTSQQSRRERSSSDKAQAFIPQRPGLPGRTISAPAGGLYKLDTSRMPTDTGNRIGQTVIEEDENSLPSGKNGGSSTRAGDETSSKPNFPLVTIAVVGQDQAGKSTFIQSALDMKQPLSSRSTTKKMSLDGTVYLVRLLEVDTKEVSLGDNGILEWPRLGNETPVIDGALVVYDVTKPVDFPELTTLLDSLVASAFPFVLVASKCDLQAPDGPVEPMLKNYQIQRTTPESPRSQKMCISMVLRSVINSKYDSIDYSYSFKQPSTQDLRHSRANSENPTATLTGAAGGPITSTFDPGVDGYGEDRQPTDPIPSNLAPSAQGSRFSRSNTFPARPHTPPPGPRLNTSAAGDFPPGNDENRQQRLHSAWRNSGGSDAFNNFLEMEDEMDGPISSPSSPESKEKAPSEGSSNDNGFTFDELVDRLISQPMSKQDSKFASIFLCLYRKFAAPATLLNALINRFERNEKNFTDQLTRIADQLRLLNVMSTWVSEYPGDLAYPKTRKRIIDFVATLEKSHFYMFAAKEVGSYLEHNAEDDNVGWPYRDGDVDQFDGPDTFLNNSGRSSPSMFLGGSTMDEGEEEEEEDPIYNMSALDLSEGAPDASSRLSSSGTFEKPGTVSSQSFTFLNVEAAQKESQNLELTPRMSLSKLQWRQFIEIPDEDFARELTRIDWIMFNSFRPRDLVRHVSISGPDKDKIQSLKHVNRMIKQFNHLAFFVASVILFRDKPKHRAKALEKFMNVAQKLRRLNNYNSLGAVIAGINGTPVHRLAQTRDMVPVQTQKDFMRLVILMGTQKSHFAYRLAWDNTFTERIPFLPLHRRDLVSAEEGNRTFVGDSKTRVNWRKFEVMGEVVLGIQRSQKTPYPHLQRFEDAARLILDMKLSGNDEDLYARSSQVEPSAGGETGRKKFGWLRS
ncbi:ras guanyl-nucleotide exchange factor RasGEF [Aspergillus avenaceus]|uniref:Ras guanyl-nucleotide exchange factor RasGEF n=1 Tax=Aspergillus avenaceus TaxID=36643 RepID=A0A5N6TIH6_ASPAV|nr:ras guanyl-nucleotide exchange factor RasGEF [Aspergillus avenaceus]